MFQATTATRKIAKLTKRIRAISGGTSASKTISILMWLIDYAQSHDNKTIHVVSESYPHLADGAIKDFRDIMVAHRYWDDRRWNNTSHEYTFETKTALKFLSIDKFGKAHGPRRDLLFINEANNIDYTIVDQLIVRTRDIIFLDWNPTSEFWFYTEMKDKRKDVDFITLTYKDNEALDQNTIAEIESHQNNKNWWRVYGLGLLGEVEGRIYTDWKIIDEIPHEARLERYGLDFGYSNDPTAVVAIYRYNGGFIFDEVLYRKGMLNKDIADHMKSQPDSLIVADSAEPKSIAELNMYGLRVTKSKKGKDSVKFGIATVQQQRCSITKRSVNGIREYRSYMWQTDANGKFLQVPEPGQDHFLDGVRYAIKNIIPDDEISKTKFSGQTILDQLLQEEYYV